MDLREMLHILNCSKWIMMVVALVTASVVGYFSFTAPAKYQAESLLIVGNIAPGSAALGGRTGIEDKTAASYAEIATVPPVMDLAAENGNLSLKPAQLRSIISASSSKDSPYLKLVGVDSDSGRVRTAVNASAMALVEHVGVVQEQIIDDSLTRIQSQMTDVERELINENAKPVKDDARIGALEEFRQSLIKQYEALAIQIGQGPNLTVVSAAQDSIPLGQHPYRNTAVAFVIGMIGGVVVGFTLDSIRKALAGTGEETVAVESVV